MLFLPARGLSQCVMLGGFRDTSLLTQAHTLLDLTSPPPPFLTAQNLLHQMVLLERATHLPPPYQMVLLERATASQRGGGQRVTAPSPPPGIQGVQRRGSVTEIPSPAAAQERRGVLMSPGGAGEADDDERLAWEIHMNEVNVSMPRLSHAPDLNRP